jgi:hypothetical protein
MDDVGVFHGHLVYFTASWYIFGRLVYFMVTWYIFPRFGMLSQEKSGNPVSEAVFFKPKSLQTET